MKIDTGWADALAKLAIFGTALVSLIGMLLNASNQKATDRALEKQFSPEYFNELKK